MSFIGGHEFVRVPTFDNDHSVTEITKSIATSIQTEATSFCGQVSHHSSPQTKAMCPAKRLI